ncbi:hypothetical protein BGZ96_006315 [Linnemannia gamsii]|uniref:F-box domain-containing protein n=1 Tax=Linnemannia gamsii TaxID=64522 RepID=A0ABQ7K3L4_9FUNG|nr:hypothetical protein BGZ96_006315 [Linnemannia gamsii]
MSAIDNHRKDYQRLFADTSYATLATSGTGIDLLAHLPLEFLQSILQTIAHQDEVSTLATLLRVNKYIASITFPYLYHEPFQKSFHQWNSNEADAMDTKDCLLRMLLTHYGTGTLIDEDIPKVVSLHFNLAAYRGTVTIATNSRPLDYAAHIRHLGLQDWAFSEPRFQLKLYPPEVQEYFNGPEFTALYPYDIFVLGYERPIFQRTIRLLCLRMLLHREATWMLASPILEQLQTLVIPASDVFDFHPAEEIRATEGWIARAQARKDKAMGSLLQFVKCHTQLFIGQLRIVTCHPSFIWKGTHQTCPAEIQFQLLHRLCESRQFLQRCRAATHLRLTSLGKDTFKWAVEEKRTVKDSMGNNTLITKEGSSPPLSLQYDDRPTCLQHGLVALEEVWIRGFINASTDEVDEIAIAFSQTLRKFKVSISKDQQDIPPAFHFGRGWVDMTVLA